MNSMLENFAVDRVMNAVAAGTSTQTSSVLDMAGWDGICYVAALGDVTIGSVLLLTAKENTANSTSSPTPTAVTDGSIGATDPDGTSYDNGLIVLDVIRPSKRYQYCTLARGTANAVIDGIFAIRYRGKKCPITQGASVILSATSTPMV